MSMPFYVAPEQVMKDRADYARKGIARGRALWEAADADSATGGPDALRGVYPIIATITADGFWRVGDDELEARTRALIDGLRGEPT